MNPVRILVVDDEQSVRMTLAANLELEGFAVAEASGGEEALALVAASSFDLVLSDIKMPGLNGVDLFLAIKAMRPGLPVVLMSAFAMEALVARAIQAGVFTVVTKPFSIDSIASLLARAVRGPIVLVVDGAQRDALATAEALCARGVRARAVSSGAEAVALCRNGSVDVCVVDLATSDQTGSDLARQILALDPSISVIGVSGGSSAAVSGARAYVHKPIETPELIRTIAAMRREQCK